MVRLVFVRYENNTVDYFLPEDVVVKKKDSVIISTPRGLQFGTVITDSKEYEEKNAPVNVYSIKRLATKEDEKQHSKNLKDASIAMKKAEELVSSLDLPMKITSAFYTFERNQLIFNFTAENRVDFRELAKRLAQVYHTRIELRQIGVRDKAKEIGGLGPCGRFLCCSLFLTDFDSVSINMAKNQNIALNPNKINGVCGRLLCCLKYEDEQYRELRKEYPKVGQIVKINDVKGKVSSVNLLTGNLVLELPNNSLVTIKWDEQNGSIE